MKNIPIKELLDDFFTEWDKQTELTNNHPVCKKLKKHFGSTLLVSPDYLRVHTDKETIENILFSYSPLNWEEIIDYDVYAVIGYRIEIDGILIEIPAI